MINSLEIVRDTDKFFLREETAVAIGKFDGVHLGHRKILNEIGKRKKDGLKTCVFTFDPSPVVFFGGGDGKELTTIEEKRKIFEQLGVDILVEFPLNVQTAATDPVYFVREVLCKRMKTRFLAAGADLSFGDRGAGNMELLQRLSPELGFEVQIVEKVRLFGETVSSTLIRKQIERGEISRANHFLGMPYMLTGTVVQGNRIGRTIGFPTLNLLPGETKLLPPNGVYYSEVQMENELYRSISNVGNKPTIGQNLGCSLETYLYDYQGNAYGKEIRVFLHDYKRRERRFDSLEELRKQLEEDICAGAAYQKEALNR